MASWRTISCSTTTLRRHFRITSRSPLTTSSSSLNRCETFGLNSQSCLAFISSCKSLSLSTSSNPRRRKVRRPRKKRLERWKSQNAEILGYAATRQLEFWGDDDNDVDDDVVPQEMLDAVERLDRKDYDVAEMMNETVLDLDQIVQFIEEARKFETKHDDKLQKLIRLL